MDEMFYNRHYIVTDENNRIVNGWSDGPHSERDTSAAVLLTDKGGYQFRLFSDGEENPTLFDWDGMIPLYKYEDGEVVRRTEEEIEADRAALPVPEETPSAEEQLRADVDYLAIMVGVEL